MGLFVPLLLGGMALAGLPWIIHRIRKPARNPTPFSSLMFVPETVPPVRDKKQIEHPWLMLLRMLILVALAAAFARPYVLKPVAAEDTEDVERQHVILVDTSLSSNAGGQFEAIRAAATARLEGIKSGEPVAVVSFNAAPEVRAPLTSADDTGVGSRGRARSAIDSLAPTPGATRFVPALQLAEQLLRPAEPASGTDGEETERIIHLVSDLQRTGLPEEAAGYALGRGIALRLAPVPPLDGGNQAVEAIALDARPPGTLYARVRLRNFGPGKPKGLLQLWLDGEKAAEEAVTLLPDSNTVFPMQAGRDLGVAALGEVRFVVEDILPADNTLYFVYEPEATRTIGVFLDPDASRAAPNRFLEAAVAESQPLPWNMAPVEAEQLASNAETLPEVMVLPEVSGLSPAVASQLAAYVDGGGRILIIPPSGGFPPALAEAVLVPGGVTPGDPRRDKIDPAAYSVMNWIDYEHPVFQAFRSAAYSDFSMVRFNNYHRLHIAPDTGVHVLARLDSEGDADGAPAALVLERGDGMVAAWAFPLDPEWTNITRTRRFIPMLHETLSLLLPPLPPRREHIAGLPAGPPSTFTDMEGEVRVQWPGAEAPIALGETPDRALAPGHVQWFGGEDTAAIGEPVNVDPAESDLGVFDEEEILLRLGAVSQDVTQAAAAAPEIDRNVVHWEYGYYVLLALAAAGLLETFLAVYYSRRTTTERHAS